MKYQLVQLNIAQFRKPKEHPDNYDFINNLDRVNAIAEQQPGFVWRLIGDANNALDVQGFDDPNIATNMSVWTDIESLVAFVYRNEDHRAIMRRRKEWFDKMDFHMVLWWIEAGQRPTLDEGIDRLNFLRANGPTARAFTFREPFSAPGQIAIGPFTEKCA